MSTPSARFVIAFDADTSGIDQSKAGLDSLRASIERDTKALKDLTASMQNLKGTAEVIRWEALPKDISKAENEVAKLASKFAKLKADFEKAPEGRREGIFAAALQNQGELEKATRRLNALKAEREKLSKSEPVRLFEDMKAGAEKLKQRLGESQTAFSRLGGALGGEAAKAAGGLKDVAAGAEAAGLATSGLTSKLSALKALGTAGVVAAIAAGLAVLAVGFGLVVARAVSFAVSMADAARSSRLLREAAAGGAEAAQGVYAATLRIEEKTGAQREEVAALANEYARLRLSAGAVEGATTAITIATQTMGAQVGSTIKGLIDRGMTAKRFWLNPLDLRGTGIAIGDVAKQLGKQMGIGVGAAETALRQGVVKVEDGIKAMSAALEESPLGAIARKQALALGVQFSRARENISRLFSGVEIEPFLEKLSGALDLFKEGSDVAKALKQALTALFQPFVDSASESMPLVEQMIWETTIAVQDLVIEFLRAGGAKTVFNDVKGAAVGLWETLKDIAAVLGVIGKGLGLLKDGLSVFVVKKGETPIDNIKRLVDKYQAEGTKNGPREITAKDATAMGINLTAGIAKGIEQGSGQPVSAIVALSQQIKKAFDAANEIKSPSKLYRRRAAEIPRGAALGIEDETPRVASALTKMAQPPELAPPSQAVRGAESTSEDRSINLEVNYYGGGTRNDARRFGQWLVDELETLTLAKGLPA